MTRKIEALAVKKQKELDMLNYEKYSSLFDDAYEFLAKKRVLLYGGTALNELMPEPRKFYEPYALPDIDVLSPDAKKIAHDMVNLYSKNKHQANTFTEALHQGTYKVYSDGIQIADITQCDITVYDMLRKKSIIGRNNIQIISPQYIRMTLHKLFSQPNDAHRWSKIYERLKSYYKTFPIVSSHSIKSAKDNDDDINADIDAIVQSMPEETVFLGKREVMMLLGRKTPIEFPFPPLLALTDQDLSHVVAKIRRDVKNISVSKIYEADHFVPSHVILSVDNKPMGIIFRLSSCVAFNQLKNKPRVAGIHTMIDMFLSMSMSRYRHFQKAKPFLESLSDELARVQQSNKSRRKLLNQFGLVCHGPSMGIATLKVERIKRIIEKKKKKKIPIKLA